MHGVFQCDYRDKDSRAAGAGQRQGWASGRQGRGGGRGWAVPVVRVMEKWQFPESSGSALPGQDLPRRTNSLTLANRCWNKFGTNRKVLWTLLQIAGWVNTEAARAATAHSRSCCVTFLCCPVFDPVHNKITDSVDVSDLLIVNVAHHPQQNCLQVIPWDCLDITAKFVVSLLTIVPTVNSSWRSSWRLPFLSNSASSPLA
eukprot:COSAG02_NODE_5235_length_4517_cov_3.028067_2_plen_201_part_00